MERDELKKREIKNRVIFLLKRGCTEKHICEDLNITKEELEKLIYDECTIAEGRLKDRKRINRVLTNLTASFYTTMYHISNDKMKFLITSFTEDSVTGKRLMENGEFLEQTFDLTETKFDI